MTIAMAVAAATSVAVGPLVDGLYVGGRVYQLQRFLTDDPHHSPLSL